MNTVEQPVLTIGHSNHVPEVFLNLLRMHGIQAVADVRSSPFSRFNPQFNKDVLERFLHRDGIHYAFFGRELGARSQDPACYENGRVQYARLAQTELFKAGLERVMESAVRYRLALMCAEKDPLECHRTLLVARALAERGWRVNHIHSDGHLETQDQAMDRLLNVTGVPGEDLFRSRDELVRDAITRQEQRIAYVDEAHAPMTPKDT